MNSKTPPHEFLQPLTATKAPTTNPANLTKEPGASKQSRIPQFPTGTRSSDIVDLDQNRAPFKASSRAGTI